MLDELRIAWISVELQLRIFAIKVSEYVMDTEHKEIHEKLDKIIAMLEEHIKE